MTTKERVLFLALVETLTEMSKRELSDSPAYEQGLTAVADATGMSAEALISNNRRRKPLGFDSRPFPERQGFNQNGLREFRAALADICGDRGAASLLMVPGVYDILAEHYGPEVMEALA